MSATSLSPEAAEMAFAAMQMSRHDQQLVLRFMTAVQGASRAARDSAMAMLTAAPKPATAEEYRERTDAVVAYLERRAAEQ